ncbi:MAG: Hpt domain-containing protein [Peptostreptococcaceae bacterium]|nr:Hpt domain-containing protein [Peptostreptococcaceae bacterium]
MSKLTDALIEYGVDIEDVKKRFVEDEEFYRECLDMFCDDNSLEQLKLAIDKGEIQEAFNAAHTIKGIAGNLGLTPLFDAVSELVEDLRADKIEGALKKYTNIELEYEKVKAITKI